MFHVSNRGELGSAFSPVVVLSAQPQTGRGLSDYVAFLAQACQHLWLVSHYSVYQQFTCVNHVAQPSDPSALMLADLAIPHRSAFLLREVYIVPAASHHLVTEVACAGRLLIAEYQVSLTPRG